MTPPIDAALQAAYDAETEASYGLPETAPGYEES